MGPFLAALLLLPVCGGAATREVAFGPPAAWVEAQALPDGVSAPESVRSGLHYLFIDHQIRLGPGATAHYHRKAWKILSTSGVENGSEIRIGFDPSYERLTLHDVKLLREGRIVGTLRRHDVKVIQQESDLDQRIYDGSLTALLFLRDVRPGDIVDYHYTIEGENPILGGRFVTRLGLAYGIPVARLRHLIRCPANRTLHVKAHRWDTPPSVTEGPQGRTYTWERRDVAPVVEDDGTPDWFDPYPSVQVGEFASWAEVARWAAALFEGQKRLSPALKSLVAKWNSSPAGDEERALEAVRFVQDQIRYLGIEIGPNSHQPHPPGQVLAQRFGDCKDKSLLLAALLAELGIEAHPALVNTGARRALDEWQPSPFAFDHAVVQARLGSKVLWIDATRSSQGGSLDRLDSLPYERALVLAADSEGLTRIPLAPEPEPTTSVEESYVVTSYRAPVRLQVRTTYRGDDAESMRRDLATHAPDDFAKRYLNYYAEDNPSIRSLAPPRFSDDRHENTVSVAESYEIPGFWKGTRRDLYSWVVDERMHKPRTQIRSMPLRVPHPVHVRHTQTIELPDALDVEPDHAEVQDAAFRFRWACAVHGKKIALTYTYQSLADWVDTPAVRKHLAAVDRARDQLGYRIDHGAKAATRRGVAADTGEAGVAWAAGLVLAFVGALGLAGIAWGVSGMRARRRRTEFARRTRAEAGESPATLLHVFDEAELERMLAARACRCGSLIWQAVERERAVYETRPMTVVSRSCAHCGAQQTLYVRLTAA